MCVCALTGVFVHVCVPVCVCVYMCVCICPHSCAYPACRDQWGLQSWAVGKSEMKAQRELSPCKRARRKPVIWSIKGFTGQANAPGRAKLSQFPGICLKLAWTLVPGGAPDLSC